MILIVHFFHLYFFFCFSAYENVTKPWKTNKKIFEIKKQAKRSTKNTLPRCTWLHSVIHQTQQLQNGPIEIKLVIILCLDIQPIDNEIPGKQCKNHPHPVMQWSHLSSIFLFLSWVSIFGKWNLKAFCLWEKVKIYKVFLSAQWMCSVTCPILPVTISNFTLNNGLK